MTALFSPRAQGVLSSLRAGLFVAGAALCTVPALAVTYTELGDAGATPGTAQGTGSGGSLSAIFGSLTSGTDADLFVINIVDPASFSATTVGSLTASALDTQLFLFTLAGRPIYSNDDEASGLTVQSALPSGNALGPKTAGLYLLGVALSGYDPVNSNNQLVFDQAPLSTEVRGPASGLQPALMSSFFSLGYEGSGAYAVTLTGAVAAAVPEPAAAWLAIAGLALIGVNRRRLAATRNA